MKNQFLTAEKQVDALGKALAARLDNDLPPLSYDVTERLRAARMQALAARKPELLMTPIAEMSLSAGQATLAWGGEGGNIWNRLASFLPLLVLIIGLIAVQRIQSDNNTIEIAEVDSALLLDELPPMAYTDPGFLQFLKVNQTEQSETR